VQYGLSAAFQGHVFKDDFARSSRQAVLGLGSLGTVGEAIRELRKAGGAMKQCVLVVCAR